MSIHTKLDRKTHTFTATLGAALLGAAAAHAQPINVQIVPSFSSILNGPTDVWTYREEGTGNNANLPGTLLPSNANVTYYIGANPTPHTTVGWNDPAQIQALPVVFAHQGAGNWKAHSAYGPVPLAANTLFMHPGATIPGTIVSNRVVVSYLVPLAQNNGNPWKAGKVKYNFTDIDPYCGDGITWSILVNSTIIATGSLFSTTFTPLASTGTVQTALFPINGNDRINFVVDQGPNNDFQCDATGLKGTIHLQ